MSDPDASAEREFQPRPAGERLVHLDIVRGFALLGVLLMNNQYWFRAPSARYRLADHPWPGTANAVAEGLLAWLWNGKSMSLFALLFGLGLTLQMERAAGRSAGFAAFVRRRQGTLLLIGLLHLTLLWSGDILHVYAVLGLALLPFLGCRTRTLLLGAGLLEAVYLAQYLLPARGATLPPQVWIDLSREAYLHGTWLQAAAFRWIELAGVYERAGAWFWPGLMALFLLGSALWRSGVVQEPERHLAALRRARTWGLGLGLVMEGLDVAARAFPGMGLPPWTRPALGIAYRLGEPVLSLGYGAALVLLVRDPAWARRLRGLGAVGKLILTNYLMQSLILTWIYNGYGLGRYDQLGPFAGVVLGLGVFGGQMLTSLAWTARYNFGPVEWLWRGISYGAFPAMKRKAVALRPETA